MNDRILTIIVLFVIGIFFLSIFGEDVDNAMTKVIVFLTLLPRPWGFVLCAFAFSIVATACVIRSSREHWPIDTEFQNEDKQTFNED